MNGLLIAKGYYEDFGRPVLESEFSDILPYIAVGFTGSGSEHYGFDDELSRDHDFEPGFNIFIPGEDVVDRKRAFQLERAYAKLPCEYAGVRRQKIAAVGGERNGVVRIEDFFLRAVGRGDGRLSIQQWLTIPDHVLAEAVNGDIFFDNYGELSQVRERLICMPEDVRLKRIAGNLLIMAQSGQYNYSRCIKRGEYEAAQLACGEFVKASLKTAFLLQGRYMPYYKWSFCALRRLLGTSKLAERLSYILCADSRDEAEAALKYDMIEAVSSDMVDILMEEGMTRASCGDLEKHAYSVNDSIGDSSVRNMNILVSVSE